MATNGLSERSASQSGSVHCRNTRKTVCQKVIQAKYIQKIEQNEPRQSLSRAPRYHHAPHPHRAFSMFNTAGHLVLSPTTNCLGWRCAQHHLWAVQAACRESPRTPSPLPSVQARYRLVLPKSLGRYPPLQSKTKRMRWEPFFGDIAAGLA